MITFSQDTILRRILFAIGVKTNEKMATICHFAQATDYVKNDQ